MKTLTVGNFKAHFSSVLKLVEKGEKIIISYGKRKEKIGVLIPYSEYKQQKRKLGILKGKGIFRISEDFEISDEDFLKS